VLLHPRDDYTRRWLGPAQARPGRPPVDRTVPLLAVEDVTSTMPAAAPVHAQRGQRAVDGVKLDPSRRDPGAGRRSGSGQDHAGRAISGLKQPSGGRILFRGQEVMVGGAGGTRTTG